MTIEINQLWNLLTESQLIGLPQTQALFSQFSADTSIPKNPPSLTKFLIDQNAISPYQSLILNAGHSGPFRYGNYTVFDRIETGVMAGQFLARHTKTGHPVLLQFFAGSKPADLETWQNIEAIVEPISQIQHPNLTDTYEGVTLANHRFVASQVPSGVSLQEKLPRKSRLPWQKACTLMAQVSRGLEQLHQLGIVHNAVSPRTIWLEKNGLVQLRLNPLPDPEFDALDPNEKGSECKLDYMAPEAIDNTNEIEPPNRLAGDLYSIGCTLYRIIAGRPPFPESDLERKKKLVQTEPPGDLSKYELPSELESLINRLLAKQPNDRPQSITEVANLLALISGKAGELDAMSIPSSKTRTAYRQSLSQFLPGADTPIVAATPEISTQPDSESDESIEQSAERLARIQAATDAIEKRKRGRWKVPAAVAAGLLTLSGIIGIMAYTANQLVVENPEIPDPVGEQPIVDFEPENSDPAASLAAIPAELRPTLFQQLIDDDNTSLWETPTNGPPIQFSYLPAAPKLLLAFRPAEILATEEGQRTVKSLGPVLESRIQQFVNRCGLELENIDRLLISLHSSDQLEYEPFFIVSASQEIETTRLMQNWNLPVRRQLENQQVIFDSPDGKTAYYVLYDDSAAVAENQLDQPDIETTDEKNSGGEPAIESRGIKRFAFGNKTLVEEVALSLGANVVSGSLGNLASWTDRDRHVNILFLRNALFNDEGQKLMGLENLTLNRELSVMLPDEVRGGLVSFHLDEGCYLELMLDKNVDLKASDLKTKMADELRQRRDQLMLLVARIPSSDYWDIVRIRYGGMLADLFQNLRWNVEHGHVVANCWLPPMAAHNLIAATEHVISFSKGTSAVASAFAGPQTLQELLKIKRDLNIANPPDLNVLMADLITEISDDFGSLPFAFNIRLIGADLEKEGITKNQRPGELVIKQKSLADILTSIMVSANSAKDISGASDPNCKLVWVVAEDPDNPGEQAILITTRAAAAEKSYELPPAFRTQ